MARIRTIKPEFWTDERLTECSLSARLLFIGLLNFADDNGNLVHSPKRIKMQVFPADAVDTSPLLAELITHGVLIEYEVNGEKFMHIKGFRKHQVINRPSKSAIPQPDFIDQSLNTHGVLSEDSLTEGKGREKEKEDMSGQAPTPSPKAAKKNEQRENALAVLEYLNFRADRAFEPVDSNLKLIVARLAEPNTTVDKCKTIIDNKVAEWGNDLKMSQYLRPATLFNATKFAQYVGERVSTTAKPWEL